MYIGRPRVTGENSPSSGGTEQGAEYQGVAFGGQNGGFQGVTTNCPDGANFLRKYERLRP